MHVYQTWKSEILPFDFSLYQNTWKNVYNVTLSTDDDILHDIHDFCMHEKMKFCKYKYSLIQKIDIWRYIKVYNNGGIYSDIDIGIKKPEFFEKLCNKYDLVVFKESPSFYVETFKWIIHTVKYFSGINDFARWNQYRQSVFCANYNSSFLKMLLMHIGNKNPSFFSENYVEPHLTYELTGPGAFTDIVNTFKSDPNVYIIDYNDGLQIIDYHHVGSWKTNFAHYEYILRNKNLILFCSIGINISLLFLLIYKKICLCCSRI